MLSMLKPIITLKDIAVSFDGEQVLKNFNLTIGDGEFVTLLGPSAAAKPRFCAPSAASSHRIAAMSFW